MKFKVPKRTQKEIKDEIRRERRYQSIANIADNFDSSTVFSENPTTPEFKSLGTLSSPSLPGKASKYSKPPQNPKNPTNPRNDRKPQNPKNPRSLQNLKSSSSSHPAFRRRPPNPKIPAEGAIAAGAGISISENRISYRVPNAPFEFQYSYTETPKVKPLALREPYLPFGPRTMPWLWTGRAPLRASKKKLREFDSFWFPPPHKKGVKPVQAPEPFLPGLGPKYVMSREEIIGEPLTKEEVKDLIKSCLKTRRQLNMCERGEVTDIEVKRVKISPVLVVRGKPATFSISASTRNKLSGNGVGARIGADQYAADVISLHSIVNDNYRAIEVKPLILAPGGFFDANWFKELIDRTLPNSMDVITHHIYNLGLGFHLGLSVPHLRSQHENGLERPQIAPSMDVGEAKTLRA